RVQGNLLVVRLGPPVAVVERGRVARQVAARDVPHGATAGAGPAPPVQVRLHPVHGRRTDRPRRLERRGADDLPVDGRLGLDVEQVAGALDRLVVDFADVYPRLADPPRLFAAGGLGQCVIDEHAVEPRV